MSTPISAPLSSAAMIRFEYCSVSFIGTGPTRRALVQFYGMDTAQAAQAGQTSRRQGGGGQPTIRSKSTTLEMAFARLGWAGWELAAMSGSLFMFKRPVIVTRAIDDAQLT